MIEKKHEADKSEQYHYARDAMKQARGFVDDMANLPFRYKLACITKGIASPMFRSLLQKLKTTESNSDV